METAFMNTENSKTNKPHKFQRNKFRQICWSSKLIYLLHIEKKKAAVQKQT